MKLTVLILTVVSTCLAQPGDNNAAQQRPARAPQSKIQYHDPDGLRVDWKLYAPQNQWKSQLAAAQRAQRAETGTAQANFGVQKQSHVSQTPIQQETKYQPYSAIPNNIKQLLAQAYAPQGPYVDPGAFFYQPNAPIVPLAAPQVEPQQPAHSPPQIEREYFNSAVTYRARGYQPAEQQNSQQIGRIPAKQGGIKYKNDDRSSDKNAQQLPYGAVITAQSQPKPQYQPYKQIPQPQIQYQQYNKQTSQLQPQYQATNQPSQPQPTYQPYNKQSSQLRYKAFTTQASQTQPQYQALSKQPQLHFQPKLLANNEASKPMSQTMAIQQLLQYQAQLPYNVIANHILYRPKEPFVPKPLPESLKLSRQYPSKVYFVKNDGQVYESSDTVKDAATEKRY